MLSFSKYQGCGNDFILIDNRSLFFPSDNRALTRHLCDRWLGIGADGIICLELSSSCDVKMRILNADGSEAEMCGNGLRCLGQFMMECGFPPRRYTVETMQRKLTVEPCEGLIKISMGHPEDIREPFQLDLAGISYEAHFLNTGVPHTVLFVENLENIPVEAWGPMIRHHPHFAPQGTNVNFVEQMGLNELAIRTYERGVEGETLACGTGAAAAALVAALKKGAQAPIVVNTRSDEQLRIDFSLLASGLPQDVWQIGPAKKTFSGLVEIDEMIAI